MKRIKTIMLHSGQGLLILFIYYVTTYCGFSISTSSSICDRIKDAPILELTASSDPDTEKVFEASGTIVVYHGFGCVKSDRSGTQNILKVERRMDVSRYAKAAVFLNGWRLKYLNGDENVAGLTTLIRNIQMTDGTLEWEAVGMLADQNFDNPYDWCYYFTVVAWNPSRIDLDVDQKDGDCDAHDPASVNFFMAENKGTTTALATFPTIVQNMDFVNKKTVAIAPRGFGFKWGDDGSYPDHQLLQIGYHMEHSEIFNEKGKKYWKGYEGTTTSGEDFSFVDTGYVSWEAQAIYKDNDARRNYQFGEMVSVLAGNDLGVIQPPFSILPYEDTLFCGSLSGSLKTEAFEIDNIPYEYAVPVLTGWELGYLCDDNKVAKIGVWIDKWHYQKDPGAATGKLFYTVSSVMLDDDEAPDFYSRHKVTVLGIKPVVSGVKPSRSK